MSHATLQGPDIDQLYRDLATARGEATQAKFFRAKFLSAEKDKANLAQRLRAAEQRADAAEAALAKHS